MLLAESVLLSLAGGALVRPVLALATATLADGAAGDVPSGANISSAGAFSWTPTEAQGPGNYTFDVCVSDGDAPAVCETITVTVNEAVPGLAPLVDEDAPVFVGGPVDQHSVLVVAEFDDPEDSASTIFEDVGFVRGVRCMVVASCAGGRGA